MDPARDTSADASYSSAGGLGLVSACASGEYPSVPAPGNDVVATLGGGGTGVFDRVGVSSGDSSSGARASARSTAAPRSERDPPRGRVVGFATDDDDDGDDDDAVAAAEPLAPFMAAVEGFGEDDVMVGPLLDADEGVRAAFEDEEAGVSLGGVVTSEDDERLVELPLLLASLCDFLPKSLDKDALRLPMCVRERNGARCVLLLFKSQWSACVRVCMCGL